MPKRSPTIEIEHTTPPNKAIKLETDAKKPSDAAVYNERVFRKLQQAINGDPEVDLLSVFPAYYKSQLGNRKKVEDKDEDAEPKDTINVKEERPFLLPSGDARVVHPLSSYALALLGIKDIAPSSQILLESLTKLIRESEVLWCSENSKVRYVVKSADIVVKSTRRNTFTEYTTLQYLEEHRPTIPVPRPQGLITCGDCVYFLMSYIPGVTLNKIWPTLNESNKLSLQNNLNDIFLDLRQLRHPNGAPLGDVTGEGCKDTRRHIKISNKPIYTSEEFESFQYSDAKAGGKTYLEFLRRLTKPYQASEITFTHGDLRDENIIVRQDHHGTYVVGGIIDWEMSGFYPVDFECTKITNTFATNETNDWYLYLPPCISPEKYPLKWLADRIWDSHVA